MARVSPSTFQAPGTPAVAPNSTAREAARAVFAQLKVPAVPASPVAIPETAPQRPLPRGSIINMLV